MYIDHNLTIFFRNKISHNYILYLHLLYITCITVVGRECMPSSNLVLSCSYNSDAQTFSLLKNNYK